MPDPPRRWDGDERGVGIADGSAFRPGVDGLAAAMIGAGWVAEDPHAHLLPHILRAAERSARTRFVDARSDAAVYVVTLEWTGEAGERRDVREEVFALAGSFAELSTHVEERVAGDAIEFDVTTGMPADATPFRTHGHLVRLRVVGAHLG